jgi:hypothetical protein
MEPELKAASNMIKMVSLVQEPVLAFGGVLSIPSLVAAFAGVSAMPYEGNVVPVIQPVAPLLPADSGAADASAGSVYGPLPPMVVHPAMSQATAIQTILLPAICKMPLKL